MFLLFLLSSDYGLWNFLRYHFVDSFTVFHCTHITGRLLVGRAKNFVIIYLIPIFLYFIFSTFVCLPVMLKLLFCWSNVYNCKLVLIQLFAIIIWLALNWNNFDKLWRRKKNLQIKLHFYISRAKFIRKFFFLSRQIYGNSYLQRMR